MPKDSMWDLFGFSNNPEDTYSQQASDVYDDITSGLRRGKKATEGILDRGKNWFDTNLDYPLLPEYKDTYLKGQEDEAWKVGPLFGIPVSAVNRGGYALGNMFFGSPINAATTLAGGATIPLARAAFKGPELALKYGPKVAEALPKVYQGMKNVSRGLEGVQATRMGAETLEDLKQGRYGKALFDAGLTALGAFGASNKPYKYVEDFKRADVERQIGEAADKELLAKGIDPNAQLPVTQRPQNMPAPTRAVDATGIEPTAREVKPPRGANANDPFWSPFIESNAKFAPNTGGDVELMIQARGGKKGVDTESLTRLQGAVDRVRETLGTLPEDARNTAKAKASAYAMQLDERDLSLAQSLGIIDPDVGTAAREIRKGLPPLLTTGNTPNVATTPGALASRPVDRGIGKSIAEEALLPEAPITGGDKSTLANIDTPRLAATERGTEVTRFKGIVDSIENETKAIKDPVERNAAKLKLYGDRFAYDNTTGTDELRDAFKLGVIDEDEYNRVSDALSVLHDQERRAARTTGANVATEAIETPSGAPNVEAPLTGVRELSRKIEAGEPLAPEELAQARQLGLNPPELPNEAPRVDSLPHRVEREGHPDAIALQERVLQQQREAGRSFGDEPVTAIEKKQSAILKQLAGDVTPEERLRLKEEYRALTEQGKAEYAARQVAPTNRPVVQGVDPNALPPGVASVGNQVPGNRPVDLPTGSAGGAGIPPPGNRPVMPSGDLPPGPNQFDENAHKAWMEQILGDMSKQTNMSPEFAINRANRQLGPDTVRSLRKTFMDPNTPQEMRRAIVDRLRQEAGLVEQPKGPIRNSIRSLTMASGEELKRIGPKSEEIIQMVRRARTDGARNFNRFINPVIDDLNRLKKEPKIFEQVVDYVEGNLKNPSDEVREVGDKITAINNMIGDEMVAAGLIKKKRADYWTHRYEGIPDGKLKENLEKMGLSGDRIDAMLKKIRESRERKTSAEFQRNDLNVPGYRKDIDVFVDHVRNSSRRLAEVEHWGKGDVIDADSPISRAIKASEDPIRARNLTERIIRGGREGEPWEQKLVQRHRTLATATQLGLAGISNMSGVLPATVKMRMSDVGKGLRKAFNRDDPDFKFMNNVNTFREFSGGFAESLGDNNLIYKVFGIEQGQNYLNRMSGAAAHSYAKMLFSELKKNPNNKGVRRELADLTNTNPDELLKQPSLSQGQIERSMINMTDMIQSSMAGEQLPHGWNRNDILRIPQVFQRTAFQITKAMKDAIKEKPTRALKIAAVGLPLGELIGDAKEVVKTGAQVGFREAQELTGYAQENDKNFFEEFGEEYPKNIGLGDKVSPTDRFAFTRKWLGAIDPDFAKNEGIVRGIGNLEQVFAFGMPSDQMTNLAEHWDSPDEWKAAVSTGLGTNYATSSAADILTQAWKGAHGNFRDVGRWGLQQVPVVGRGMAREVETTAQQKRRDKKGKRSVPDFPE